MSGVLRLVVSCDRENEEGGGRVTWFLYSIVGGFGFSVGGGVFFGF